LLKDRQKLEPLKHAQCFIQVKELSLIEGLGYLVEHFKGSVEVLISLPNTFFFIEVKLRSIHAAH